MLLAPAHPNHARTPSAPCITMFQMMTPLLSSAYTGALLRRGMSPHNSQSQQPTPPHSTGMVRQASTARMAADGAEDVGSLLLEGWERGESTAGYLRPLIDSASSSPRARAAASVVAASTANWRACGRPESSTLKRCVGPGCVCDPFTTLTTRVASCRTCIWSSGRSEAGRQHQGL